MYLSIDYNLCIFFTNIFVFKTLCFTLLYQVIIIYTFLEIVHSYAFAFHIPFGCEIYAWNIELSSCICTWGVIQGVRTRGVHDAIKLYLRKEIRRLNLTWWQARSHRWKDNSAHFFFFLSPSLCLQPVYVWKLYYANNTLTECYEAGVNTHRSRGWMTSFFQHTKRTFFLFCRFHCPSLLSLAFFIDPISST